MRGSNPGSVLFALLVFAGSSLAQEPPRPAVSLRPIADAAYPSGRAVVAFELSRAADLVEIDVVDAAGAIVAGWSGGAKGRQGGDLADRMLLPAALTNPGVNEVAWDLHASGYFAAGAAGAPPRYAPGPLVPPGQYRVQMRALGQTVSQPLAIVAPASMGEPERAALGSRFALAMQIRGSASAASAAVRRVRAMRGRVDARLAGSTDQPTLDAGRGLLGRLDEIEGAMADAAPATAGVVALHQSLSALEGAVETAGGATEPRAEQYRTLSGALQARIVSLNSLLAGDFARFDRGNAAVPPAARGAEAAAPPAPSAAAQLAPSAAAPPAPSAAAQLAASAAAPPAPSAAAGARPPAPGPLAGAVTEAPFGATTINYDSKGVDFWPWVRTFIAALNRSWTIPRSAMAGPGRVVISFVVLKAGWITDVKVATPSGIAAYDDSARKAMFGASLTEKLPDAFPDTSCPMRVTFYFNQRPPARATVGK